MARSVRSNNNNDGSGNVNAGQEATVIATAVTSTVTAIVAPTNIKTTSIHLITYPEWLERKSQVEERLEVVSIPLTKSNNVTAATTAAAATATNKKRTRGGGGKTATATAIEKPVDIAKITNNNNNNTIVAPMQMQQMIIPYVPKTDVHWDFVMKEMMWLGADFKSERKRQIAAAKKLASSVQKYHDTKEKRRLRQLSQAEFKRKKLAAKISRDVKSWWTKLEKVVAYKQKRNSDEERQKAMNKQLVALVRQTEKYTESVTNNNNNNNKKTSIIHHVSATEEEEDDSDIDDMMSTGDNDDGDSTKQQRLRQQQQRRRRRRRLKQQQQQQQHEMTIEEALSQSSSLKRRKTKSRIVDYSRMKLKDTEFYGESTADEGEFSNNGESCSETNDDESYSPPPSDDNDDENYSDDNDDETTLRSAMEEEMKARRRRKRKNNTASSSRSRRISSRRQQQQQQKQQQKQQEDDDDDEDEDEDLVEIYSADPKELRKLYEEQEMAIEQVLQRLRHEQDEEDDNTDDGEVEEKTKHVQFAATAPNHADTADNTAGIGASAGTRSATTDRTEEETMIKNHPSSWVDNDPGADADDDGDASDVEDYHDALMEIDSNDNNNNKGEGEKDDDGFFQVSGEPEPDDETTMMQEENLPKEMTAEEEIDLLKKTAEMPIEELRKMYSDLAAAQEHVDDDDDDDDDGDDSIEEEENEQISEDVNNEIISSLVVDDNKREIREKEENSGTYNDEDDGEFKVSGKLEVDDETTMEAEEKLGRDMTYEEELDMLNKENDMSIEELRAMYAGINSNTTEEEEEEEEGDDSNSDDDETPQIGGSVKEDNPDAMDNNNNNNNNTDDDVTNDDDGESQADKNSATTEDDDGEFQVSGMLDVDDETTMEAEERLGRDMTYREEIDMLNRENEMSVEELRAMYAGTNNNDDDSQEVDSGVEKMDIDDDNDDDHREEEKNASQGGADTEEVNKKRDREEEPTSDSSLRGSKKRARQKEEVIVDNNSENDDGTAALDALEESAKKARETLASRPFLIPPWVKLRKYQQVGLNWLVSLQSRRLNGILADEMGLGKTLQTISLLAYLAAYKGIWGPHLVIVPTSVIINWETELKRFCPGFKVLTYYGSAKRRKELRTGWTKSNWYHVVITSYQLAVQDAFAFKRKKWYYLILDEAQNIKNFQSQRWQTLINFNTQRRLLLTGTPLQNSLMELWSLLHFLMPYIFKSRKEFSYWFSNPMNNMIEGGNRNDDVIKRLHGIIRPFVLRRLKKDVETQMPGKFEHIVKCQLSRRQMTLYEEFLSRSSTRKALKKGGNFMGMMTVLMQLRKVCNHPDLFEPRSVITPFILPSIPISVPRCVCEVQKDRDFVDSISVALLQPLWCGSSGLPSIGAALRHNQIESDGLKSLCGEYKPTEILEFNDDGNCPTELQTLITEIYKARNDEQVSRTEFHNIVNRRRCGASVFPYSSQLLNIIETECNIFGRCEPAEIRNRQVIETPSKLLELRKMDTDRAIDMEQTIEKFVFRVPPAGGRAPKLDNGIPKTQGESGFSKDVEALLLEPLEEVLEPYRKARARLSSFFPDKKLIQYDAGKLQALAPLLRKLKEGAHRCLIFTQMSKVLDVLEAFLSMNGHTYLRLDGSTGVDRRQRYMDRFNNDTKIFCFILSTRSGGMGINLTGADTVIFYDSDWNPAMDAQAQDRAHRIGQTRDVHIYRLITEHSIEENILIKAQKKKNLDILVMDQGQFDASAPPPQEDVPTDDIKDVYTKKGLQAILGVSDDEPDTSLVEQEQPPDMSKEQMEKAMASLEDEDDVKALQGAQKEAVEDLKEFDENTAIPKGSDDEEDGPKRSELGKTVRKKPVKKGNKKEGTDTAKSEGEEQENSDEKQLEKEFAAWQSTEGFDEKAIEQSLSPMEKYGLKFREDIDPFYSIFFINEQRRKMEVMEGAEEIDIEEVERKKAMEEYQAIENQDLLGTGIRPEDLVRQRSLYRREKARLRSDKKRRKITGEFWSQKIDGVSNKPFWYNDETGEATWDIPRVVVELRAEELAIQQGWSHLPIDPLFHIMGYLLPFPERQVCGAVCRQWRLASTDARFVIHVYPVEMIALASREPNKRHYNHHASIEDALAIALPGDIIELGDGHYWVNEPGIVIDKPIRFIGDENNPANVVVEMSGSVRWTAKGGWMEGITFRRPKMASSGILPSFPMLEVKEYGKIDMIRNVFDNDGSTGPVANISGGFGHKGKWRDVVFRNGGSAGGIQIDGDTIKVELIGCTIKGCQGDGLVSSNKAKFKFTECTVENNLGYGICLKSAGCQGELYESCFKNNTKGVIKKVPHCIVTSRSNIAFLPTNVVIGKQIPGFKLTTVQLQK